MLLFVGYASAATTDVEISLRPHCQVQTSCADFVSYDQETFITNGLKAGDTLDLDIVLKNPSAQPIQSVQSWLEYDPTVLRGIDIRMSDDFPLVAPGESDFTDDGIAKLGASNVSGGVTASEFVFARVQFQVLSPSAEISLVKFHGFNVLGQEGRTKALVVEGGRTVNVLKKRPNDLRLFHGDGPPPTTIPNQPTGSTPGSIPGSTPGTTPTPSPSPSPSSLSQLQPQNLRVMTQGSDVYLVWDALNDPNVAGYNVYYGTQPGRYAHRRTVPRNSTNQTIRLPQGAQYYFSVTAFDNAQNESEFGYEVGVIVGDPTSSTAPFRITGTGIPGSSVDGSLIGGTGSVPGRTGLPLGVLLGIVCIALGITGSFFLYRFHARA